MDRTLYSQLLELLGQLENLEYKSRVDKRQVALITKEAKSLVSKYSEELIKVR